NEKNDGRRFGINTKLKEMENYIHPDLIEEFFDIDLSNYKENWCSIDVPKTLVNLAKKEINREEKREKIIKDILNSSVSKNITKQHLEDLGVYEEVESWFKTIAELYNSNMILDKKVLIM